MKKTLQQSQKEKEEIVLTLRREVGAVVENVLEGQKKRDFYLEGLLG